MGLISLFTREKKPKIQKETFVIHWGQGSKKVHKPKLIDIFKTECNFLDADITDALRMLDKGKSLIVGLAEVSKVV